MPTTQVNVGKGEQKKKQTLHFHFWIRNAYKQNNVWSCDNENFQTTHWSAGTRKKMENIIEGSGIKKSFGVGVLTGPR